MGLCLTQINMNFIKYYLFFAIYLLMVPSVYAAVPTLAELVDAITLDVASLPNLIATFAALAGVGIVVKGIMKLKEHNESKGQVKLSLALSYIIAGSFLVALGGSAVYTGGGMKEISMQTIFGGGAKPTAPGTTNAKY